jgi:hypothetical protein
MIDLAAARANAMSWLHTPLGVVSREGAIAEELLAYDVLDALDEISRLRALLVEACDSGRGLAAIGLDLVNGRAPSISTSEMIRSRADRLAAICAQVEEGK